MGLVDVALGPIRSVIGTAEHEAEHAMPVRDIEEIQQQILEGVNAMRHATESVEAHIEVVEALAAAVPTLTAAVVSLTEQLGQITRVLAPVAAVEQDFAKTEQEVVRAEHVASRLGGLFGRHPTGDAEAAQQSPGPAGEQPPAR